MKEYTNKEVELATRIGVRLKDKAGDDIMRNVKEKRNQLLRVNEEWLECHRCDIRECMKEPKVGEFSNTLLGTKTIDALFISDMPREKEIDDKPTFGGYYGYLIKRAVREALERSPGMTLNYAFTYATACYNYKGVIPTDAIFRNCFPRVQHLINILNPSAVVCIGAYVRDMVRPIIDKDYPEIKTYVVHHPSYIVKKGGQAGLWYRHNYINNMKKVLEDIWSL